MLDLIRNHPRALVLAVLVHLAFLVLLVVSFHFSESPLAPPGKQRIVHAVTVDESKVQAELNKLRAQDRQRRERQRAQEQAAQRARDAVLREQQRLAKLKQQRAAEQQRVAAEQQKRLAEQARVAKLKQQQAALAKQRAEEAKRQAALEAQRKQAEAEAKRKQAQEARERAAAQKALQAKVAAAAKQMAAERAAREKAQREAAIVQYTQRIEAAIRQHWQVPPSAQVGMSCQLKLRLIPDGEVVKIDMVQSSGDPAFDQSVIAAVRAASPLPVPSPQSGLFEQFRELNLPFDLKREDLKQEG